MQLVDVLQVVIMATENYVNDNDKSQAYKVVAYYIYSVYIYAV
jgi:hypothetical protein